MSNFVRATVLALLCVGAAPAQENVIIEQIIAKVNGDVITRSEYERELNSIEERARGANLPPARLKQLIEEQRKNTLRDLIDQRLLVQRARDLNLNVDADVTKYLANLQLENKIADPEKFQEWVREYTKTSFEDFKSDIRDRMLTNRVVGSEVSGKINIPRADIEKFYAENKQSFVRQERIFLREILISTEGKTGADLAAAEKKAADLVARARKGERFPELARDNSDSPSAREGGAIPPLEKGSLRDELKGVWEQARGYVTDPIKLESGWLILRVDEKHQQGLAPLEEVENEIREQLYGPLFEPKIREYLSQLRLDSFLEIREGYNDAGAVTGKSTAWNDPALLRPETITKEEVAAQIRLKRLLWMMPVPGTRANMEGTSSSK